MSWIRIHNRAINKVNVQLSNAGFVYHYENHVSNYTEFFVAGIGWDFMAVFDCDDTVIDPAKGNRNMGINIGLIVLGALGTLAGIVLTVATVGAAAEVAIAGVTLTVTTIKTIAGASAVIGGITAVAGITMTIDAEFSVPAQITGLYGIYDYEIYLDGEVTQVTDLQTKK